MIYRVTSKLAKKLKLGPVECLSEPEYPFIDWTANLFLAARLQYIMVTNSCTLYSIVLPGRGITNTKVFAERVVIGLHDFMVLDRTESLDDTYIELYTGDVTFSRTGDRRVLGSMTDLIHAAQLYLVEFGLPLSSVPFRVNETPMSMLGYKQPRAALLAMYERGIVP